MTRSLRCLSVILLALAGCGDLPTDDRGPAALRVLPVFEQTQGSLPILTVDELRVRVYDLGGEVLLAQAAAPVSPSDVEVEVELRIDATPGEAVTVEVEFRDGVLPVYVGGPVAVVPSEVPVEVSVGYVGAGACGELAGSVGVGPIGGAPVVVQGELEVGDCYRDDEASFADRWRVDLPGDAGLTLAVDPDAGASPLFLRLTELDGTPLVDPVPGGVSLAIAAGSYVAEVTSADPLARLAYDLSVVEFDRCDAETGQLSNGVTFSQALTAVDCPLASGRTADLWGAQIASAGAYRIDLESGGLDVRLLVTDSDATDPFAVQPFMEDDDGGFGRFDALVAGTFPAGSYRVWSTTSTPLGGFGDYQIALRRLAPGAPTLEVRDVVSLGANSGQCGSSQAYLFSFGFEDGDGDLVTGGGVTIRLTGIPSGIQETKGVGWESFPALNPYAGYAEIVTCESFVSGDSSKRAEFFIFDAAGRTSAIYSQELFPVAGRGAAPGADRPAPVAGPVGAPEGESPSQPTGGRNR